MRKFFSFLLALTAAVAVNAAQLQVTLNFTSNTWGIPEGSGNITKGTNNYSNGTYSIVLSAESNGYYYNTNGFLIMGKNGTSLSLPAFDFAVSKIAVTGGSGASTAVVQNLYVGDDAISDKTTGAKGVTNNYLIPNDKRAAGTIYKLMVGSNHNTQITKIEIFKEDAGDPEPACARKDTISVHAAVERIKAQNLGPCYVDGVVDSLELFYLIDGNINIWMKDTSLATPDTIKAFKILNTNNVKFVAGENIPFAKGDTIRVLAKALEAYTDKSVTPNKTINEINEGTFIEKLGTSTAVTPTEPINPDTISVDSALVLLAAGDMDLHIVRGVLKSFDDKTTLATEGVLREITLRDVEKTNKTIVGYMIYGGPDNQKFNATHKCGLPFIEGDTLLILSKGLKDYNGKKEINGGFYVSRDGQPDRPERCEVCTPELDTLSVVEALAYIEEEGYCPKIVKGVVSSISNSIKNDAVETVVLTDIADPSKTIECFKLYAGYDGTDTAKVTAINQLPFVKGDTIYVYGKTISNYKKSSVLIPQLSSFVYFVRRVGGDLQRTFLDVDNFNPKYNDDIERFDFTFTKQGDANLKLVIKYSSSNEYAIAGTYTVSANSTLKLSDGTDKTLVSGELTIVIDSMPGEYIYYSVDGLVRDDNDMYYVVEMKYESDHFVDDNPNITSALAYELARIAADAGKATTAAAYNVYGYWVSNYQSSSGSSKGFYLSDFAGVTGGKYFEAFGVHGPVAGDYVRVKNIKLKMYYDTAENDGSITSSGWEKLNPEDAPVIRDVKAPERAVAEALAIGQALAKGAYEHKYYTVCGPVLSVEENEFLIGTAESYIKAYKCVSADEFKPQVGDNVKVKGILYHYYKAASGEDPEKDEIEISYGQYSGATGTALPEVLVERSYDKAIKAIDNGQIVIIKNGVRYNLLGGAIR